MSKPKSKSPGHVPVIVPGGQGKLWRHLPLLCLAAALDCSNVNNWQGHLRLQLQSLPPPCCLHSCQHWMSWEIVNFGSNNSAEIFQTSRGLHFSAYFCEYLWVYCELLVNLFHQKHLRHFVMFDKPFLLKLQYLNCWWKSTLVFVRITEPSSTPAHASLPSSRLFLYNLFTRLCSTTTKKRWILICCSNILSRVLYSHFLFKCYSWLWLSQLLSVFSVSNSVVGGEILSRIPSTLF